MPASKIPHKIPAIHIAELIIDKESAMRLDKEVAGKLLSTLRIKEDKPDIPIPVEQIAALGKFIILSKSVY